MSLARAHVWNPGDLLKAADLNGEFDSILINPISLISPATGAINFNLTSHYGLRPSAVSASSGSAGQALIVSGTAAVWGTPTVATTNLNIVTGSTGQVLAVTSSNSAPAFQVLPIDGGLSTSVPTAGMVYYISSSAGVLKGLPIGTSGQVLTVSTALLPGWSAATGGSGGTGNAIDPAIYQFVEDFKAVYTTANFPITPISATGAQSSAFTGFVTPNGYWLLSGTTPLYAVDADNHGGIATFASSNVTMTVSPPISFPRLFTTDKIVYDVRYKDLSTQVGQRIIGFTTGSFSTTPANGIFFLSTTGSATVSLVVISSAGSTTLSAGVSASSYHTYHLVISSASIDLTVDGAAVGSITSFNPSSGILPIFGYSGFTNVAPGGGTVVDYMSIITSGR